MQTMHAYTSMVMAADAHAAELHELGRSHTGLRHALRPARTHKRYAVTDSDRSSPVET
jgi:hypothetical protein